MTRLLIAFVAVGVSVAVSAGEHPYGHRVFYPSPERPVGWRGDGSGVFPAAFPVLEWDDPAIASPVRVSEGVAEDFVQDDADAAEAPDAASANKDAKPDSLGHNIIWKTRLPDYGHCAPIAVGDKVFVACEPDRLICLSAMTGKILWEDFPKMDEKRSSWNGTLGRAMPTPCSDGKHVYTKCTTGALICYDLEGTRKWSFPLINTTKEQAIASPILADGKVIVKEMVQGKVYALDADTGKQVWVRELKPSKKSALPLCSNFDAYAVMRVGGRTLLVDAAGHALDAEDGSVIARGLGRHGKKNDGWNGMMNCSVPGWRDVNLFAHMWRWGGFKAGHTAAYLNGSTRLYAYRFTEKADGKGVDAELFWETKKDFWGTNRGVTIVGGKCYWVSRHMEELSVIDMKTGDVMTFPWIFGIWSHTSVYGGNPYKWIYSHCVSDGYFLYQPGGSGLTAVVLLGPIPRLVAINKTEGGYGGATLHGDRIFIHSRNHVYAIGNLQTEALSERFEAAQRQAAEGKHDEALVELEALARHSERHIQCRAVRQMIEQHGARSIPSVARALGMAHDWAHDIAIEAARRLEDVELTEAVAAAAPAAVPRARATLLHMLAVRGESKAASTVLAGVADKADVVREAALCAARSVGVDTVAEAIVGRYADAAQWERPLMIDALTVMPGREVDAVLAKAIASDAGTTRAIAAELLGRRGATAQSPAVLALRQDPSGVVRLAAARAMRGVAGSDDLGAVAEWLTQATGDERAELIRVGADLLGAHADPEAATAAILAAWPGAESAEAQAALVKVLGSHHSKATLAGLRLLATGKAHAAALVTLGRELTGWSSAAARPLLEALMDEGRPARVRYVAYLGYVRSIEQYETDEAKRLKMLSQAQRLAPVPDDRRFVYEACSRQPTVGALELVVDAMNGELGGVHAVTAVTVLAPLTLEKDYSKTMACVKDAMSAVEMFRKMDHKLRKAQQARLKSCMTQLQAIAAKKKLVPIDAGLEDDDLGLDFDL